MANHLRPGGNFCSLEAVSSDFVLVWKLQVSENWDLLLRTLGSQFIQKRCFDNQRYSNSNLETLDKMQVSCTFLWFGGVI